MHIKIKKIIESANTVIFNKETEIKLFITCLLAKGHLLIEDVPGVGKTTLVQTIAKLLGFENSRIQFTNDILPAEIIGSMIFNVQTNEFKFNQGPIFSHLVLADELNRASPRTQSAFLQAMEEHQVSVEKNNFQLPNPFFIIATQNPTDQSGTFPLPESQIDRFLMSMNLNFTDKTSEIKIFKGDDSRKQIHNLKPILETNEILNFQNQVEKVFISDLAAEYIYRIINETRISKKYKPLSTRTGIALARAAKAFAFIDERDFITSDDIKNIAPAVLSHRLGLNSGVKLGQQLVSELINHVQVPV